MSLLDALSYPLTADQAAAVRELVARELLEVERASPRHDNAMRVYLQKRAEKHAAELALASAAANLKIARCADRSGPPQQERSSPEDRHVA